MTTITSCPVCKNQTFEPFLNCKDYTVSRETFQLATCKNCTFVLTTPRPDDDKIGAYYQSEEYISHTNRAASIIDSIYLRARKYTLDWKLKLVNGAYDLTNKKILDYGCG